MGRGFLISLLRILRDYLVVIYLIKCVLRILLRLSYYKETLYYILIVNILGLESYNFLNVMCIIALISRLRRVSFIANY